MRTVLREDGDKFKIRRALDITLDDRTQFAFDESIAESFNYFVHLTKSQPIIAGRARYFFAILLGVSEKAFKNRDGTHGLVAAHATLFGDRLDAEERSVGMQPRGSLEVLPHGVTARVQLSVIPVGMIDVLRADDIFCSTLWLNQLIRVIDTIQKLSVLLVETIIIF